MLVLSVALGAVVIVNAKHGFNVASITVQIAVATLGATHSHFARRLYAAVLRIRARFQVRSPTQLVLDQLTWTMLVYLTGGAATAPRRFTV